MGNSRQPRSVSAGAKGGILPVEKSVTRGGHQTAPDSGFRKWPNALRGAAWLWIRGGEMELDPLMQPFFIERSKERIGILAQEREAQFSKLRYYEMNFDNLPK